MKKTNHSKQLALFIALIMLLSLFSGCSIQHPDDLAASDIIAGAYARNKENAPTTEQPVATPTPELEAEEYSPAAPNSTQQPQTQQNNPLQNSGNSGAKQYSVDDFNSSVNYDKYESKTASTTTGNTNNGSREVSSGSASGNDQYSTNPVPMGKPMPVEWQGVGVDTSTVLYATLEIRCDTIANNLDKLTAGKEELIPANGVIYPKTTVAFYKGESVFDILQRECQRNRIQMEFMMYPVYNSAYIEGINNLYEFDVGDLSGWMYKVDGWYPNYGASRYQLTEGEEVVFSYTCDLGRDLGVDWLQK